MLCHCAEVAKNFQCCTTSCVFCNVIGEREISLQEVINVNEAQRIAERLNVTRPSPLRWGLGM